MQKTKPLPRLPPVCDSLVISCFRVVLIGKSPGGTPHEQEITSAIVETRRNMRMKCASDMLSGNRTATSEHPGATPTTPVPLPSASATPRQGVPW